MNIFGKIWLLESRIRKKLKAMLCSKAFPEDSTRLCDSVMAAVTQVKVADALKKRAPETKPDLFINVGDNFYWGGVNTAPRHWNC